MKTALSKKKCVPCQGGEPPLRGAALDSLFDQLTDGWVIVDDHHLEKQYKFSNFRQALTFTNKVGELAESEGHHPDIYLSWGRVKLKIFTHKINGLTESDFILAAKIDAIDHGPQSPKGKTK